MNSTKKEILEKSLQLFSGKTYHGASVRDIAKAVDKRESSIYSHFSSKEEILEMIIEKHKERNIASLILTDELLNIINKPDKFFTNLSEKILNFLSTKNEQMFVQLLLTISIDKTLKINYSLNDYLNELNKTCGIVFSQMMEYKIIKYYDLDFLSKEFLSPLFTIFLENLFESKLQKKIDVFVKNHTNYFWRIVKL